MISDDLKKRVLPIKMLLLDVDGVLTDGSIIYTDQAQEIKVFNVKDGLGLRLLMDAGIGVGIITGRRSRALTTRCDNLGISMIYDGVKDKDSIFKEIMQHTGLSAREIAFAGDDLPDIRIMKLAGLSLTVADACPEIRALASFTTMSRGGNGAVREICELILKSQGLWDKAIERFL